MFDKTYLVDKTRTINNMIDTSGIEKTLEDVAEAISNSSKTVTIPLSEYLELRRMSEETGPSRNFINKLLKAFLGVQQSYPHEESLDLESLKIDRIYKEFDPMGIRDKYQIIITGYGLH